MIHFVYPELFLLAIPLGFAYRRWSRATGTTRVLRLTVLAALLLALTGPELNLAGRGMDVVIVADRSRSLPAESVPRIRELITNLQHNRGFGDRIGLVTFGSTAAVESVLSEGALAGEYTKVVQPDGSDLNAALDKALDIVNRNRPSRILVLSDGEANGPAPTTAGRRARDLKVPIDYREFPRPRAGDVAVDSLVLPETVTPREPFQYSVWIHADREAVGRVAVLRDGVEIVSDEGRRFTVGMNRLYFRDLLEAGGLHNYEVRLEVAGDPVLENNRGAGVVLVEAGPRLLVLNGDGSDDNFVRALRSGRVPVDVASSQSHPLTRDALDRYRAVVLENVPASHFGRIKLDRLAQFVEDQGGGLLVTGGERSFGTGGYFKSSIDPVLPVSMEMRQEHRKNRLAMAVVLDRSGSMAMPAAGGKLKMDLANLGAAACVRLLSAGDSVALIAVDSSAHVVQQLTPVDDPEPIAQRALRIQSEGGGIFIYEALVAAGEQLLKAEQTTKHVILFSDAADSEEPGDYQELLAKFERVGITVSVIGLGSDADSDAKLLQDIARLGKGNIMFTADPEELPRLFAEDTMNVARSTFIKKEDINLPNGIPGEISPAARLLGDFGSGAFPSIDGYNLSYLKNDASLAVVSQDEFKAPWSAYWYRGLGRAAAITLEVDGQYTGAFGGWKDYADFAITHARWLLGTEAPEEAFLTVTREGQEAVATLELNSERPAKGATVAPALSVLLPGEERQPLLNLPFQWTGPDTLEARFRLDQAGTYRTLVDLGKRRVVRGPAVTLPYSPEYMPRAGLPTGAEVLDSLADLTGGKARLNVVEILADPPRAAGTLALLPWLAALGVVLLLLEIAGRRLSWWSKLEDIAGALVSREAVPAGGVPRPAWGGLFHRRGQRATAAQGQAVPTRSPASAGEKPAAAPKPGAPSPAPAPAATTATTSKDVFEQAKRRARRRLE